MLRRLINYCVIIIIIIIIISISGFGGYFQLSVVIGITQEHSLQARRGQYKY